MAALLLLALFLHRSTVVLQRLAGVLVLFFQRADLRRALVQTHLLIALQLVETGELDQHLLGVVAQLLVSRLLRGECLVEPGTSLLDFPDTYPILFSLLRQACPLGGENLLCGTQLALGFLAQALRQSRHQVAQLCAELLTSCLARISFV
ncbi:hypothetical protein D3C78_1335120 [compost metagenome]